MTHIQEVLNKHNQEPTSPVVIVVTAQKGGVGKTTTVGNLAVGLAGHPWGGAPCRVLIVDLDTQGHCSTMFGMQPTSGIYDFFVSKRTRIEDVVTTTEKPYLDIMSGNEETAVLSAVYAAKNTSIDEIQERMLTLVEQYDVIIFDAPDSSGKLRDAALQLADIVIVPTRPENLSVSGVHPILNALNGRKIIVLPTMVQEKTSVHAAYLREIARWWPTKVIHTTREPEDGKILAVPYRQAVIQAAEAGRMVIETDPRSAASAAYNELIQYVRASVGAKLEF